MEGKHERKQASAIWSDVHLPEGVRSQRFSMGMSTYNTFNMPKHSIMEHDITAGLLMFCVTPVLCMAVPSY